MAEAGGGSAVELFANRRVSDGDERAGTLHKALAPQLRDTVLGDDVLDHMSGGDHTGALSEDRLDLRNTLFRH